MNCVEIIKNHINSYKELQSVAFSKSTKNYLQNKIDALEKLLLEVKDEISSSD